MVYQLSEDEIKEAQAIEANYVRLLKECEEQARELRPETGDPADTYTSYGAYLEAGSKEWKETIRRRVQLFQQYNATINDYINNCYDEHFRKIANNSEAIVQDAFNEIDVYIPRVYNALISEFDSDFIHDFARATNDGFLLDSDKIIIGITDLLSQRHTKHLQKADIDRINEYIVKAVAESSLTSSSEGELLGRVTKKPKPVKIEAAGENVLAVRPKNYVTTVDRLTKQIFSNEITLAKDDPPDFLCEVRLDDNGNVCVYSALNYQELLSSGEIQKIPKMTDWDYGVHDAIATLISSGNRVMSYDMMYRAMTGKITGKVTVTDEIRKDIDAALDKFRGTFRAEYDYTNEDGELVTRTYDEPLVTFQRITDRVKVNGKIITGGIRLPDDTKYDPPLLKWARENGNEIDTRDITLLDVPKLNNGDESYVIKMCLYRRIISMKNKFEHKNKKQKKQKQSEYDLVEKLRTIRYDYVYAALHEEFQDQEGKSIYQDPDTNKRRLLKDKIDRCMKYWTDKGLITGYKHKRDKSSGNAYYAVMVSFMPKE